MSFWSLLREKFLIGGTSQPLKIPVGIRRIKNLINYGLQSRIHPVKPSYFPLTLMIEVSTACNLMCPRCEREATSKRNLGKFTSLDTIAKILPILPYVYSVYLVAGLGEGLLNPHFWKIVTRLKRTGTKVGYFTNGLLLKKDNIDKTFSSNVDSVLVSFDSLKKEKFEVIRKGAKYDEVLANLKSLINEKKRRKNKSITIGINFAAHKSTIEEMPEVVKFAKKIGLDFVHFTFLIAHRKEFIKECVFYLDKRKLEKIFSQTQKTADQLKIAIRLPSYEAFKNCMCQYPWREMTIFGNGDVSPCPHFRQAKKYYFTLEKGKVVKKEISYPKLIMGNIYKEPVLKIWNNKTYQNLRRGFKENSPDLPCRFCYFRYGFH